MVRKFLVLSAVVPALAAAQPPIRDCRLFLWEMSDLGFRAGLCNKDAGRPEVVRLRARQQECSALTADSAFNAGIGDLHRALYSQFLNEMGTRQLQNTAQGGKETDANQTEFCRRHDKFLEDMAARYLQP